MSLQKNYINLLAPDAGVAPIASAIVIAANDQRGYLIIVNISDVSHGHSFSSKLHSPFRSDQF